MIIIEGNQVISVFVNGTPLVNTDTNNPSTPLETVSRAINYVGRTQEASGSTGSFNGFLDELVIYNRVFDSDEISCLYEECDAPCKTC